MTKRARLLRLLAAGLVAAAVVVGYWFWHAPPATKIRAGQAAPELQLYSIGGVAPTRLGQFRGRPVLLVLFVGDCPACEEVVPRVERLHREFGRRGLVVLGVSADADPAEREAFVRRLGITFIVLQDPGGGAIRRGYGTSRLPELYLIDRAGTVRAVYPGRLESREQELRDRVEVLLARPKAG